MRITGSTFKTIASYAVGCCVMLALSIGYLHAQTTAPSAPVPVAAKSALTIELTGFRNAKGKVSIALYRDAKGFPNDPTGIVESQRLEIDSKTLTATAVFANLPQGAYAVSVLHDENLKGKMDFDASGIPQEGYGISNNPDTTQGPPTPESATFTVNQQEKKIEIKIVYWQ